MWIVFRKSDKQIVGSSVDAGVVRKKEEALGEVVAGLRDRLDPSEYDAIEVTDQAKLPSLTRAVGEGRAKLKDAAGKLDVVDETPEAATVRVTTDAKQFHPVDGLPLLPGDGASFLVVTLQKASLDQARDLARKTVDNDVIWLRTTGGSLREDKDDRPAEIRSVTLASGTAKFRLFSENAKRVVTVEMLSANPSLRLGGLRVEFV